MNPGKDKAILFLSGLGKGLTPYLEQFQVNSVLLSYHYVRKQPTLWAEYVDYCRRTNSLMMLDSGAFTFKADSDNYDHWCKPDSYDAYLDEFLNFCYDNANDIYCTVNMDMDDWVGVDVVDAWNDKFFKPLSKITNVIFNAVSMYNRKGIIDQTGITRFTEYVEEFDYVGINRKMIKQSGKVFALAQMNKRRVHGFAITSLKDVQTFPFFSIDSSTWGAAQRFGATFLYDGKNFRRKDGQKHLRKNLKLMCRENGIDYDSLMEDKPPGTLQHSIFAWKGFEKEFLLRANLKLRSNAVSFYDKRKR